MAIKKKLVIQISLLFLAALFIVPRLWLEFRPIPISAIVERPMTQVEWERLAKSSTAVATNLIMIDHLPYPAPNRQIVLSFWDIQTIRALASWNSLFPYRTIALNVSSQTNANMSLYERNTCELEFTKDKSGWHMRPVSGIIDWVSESAKPKISFH